MKKFLFVCLVTCCAGLFASQTEFAEFREKAKKVKRLSDADYKLGMELMKEMKKQGMKKKLVLGKRVMYTEPVTYRSGRLWYSHKKWFDHNLFISRDMWQDTPYVFQQNSIQRSIELIRQAGLDGFVTILARDNSSICFSRAAAQDKHPQKIHVVPRLFYNSTKLEPNILQKFKYLAEGPTWKLNGKPVSMAYSADRITPQKNKENLAYIKSKIGYEYAHLHGVGSMQGTGGDPYNYYIRKKAVPATLMLRYYDRIIEYLDGCAGIVFHNYLPTKDGLLYKEYYDEIILPLYTAVLARPEFNGKKVFGLQILAGYGYYLGSQTLSRNGTKTLRDYLELCKKYAVDAIFCFEWDETNEDTCLEPTVCKPMSSPRILRYYSDTFKGKKPTPFAGDDLSLPNLIVSHPRQYIPGHAFDLEVLNVPDTTEKLPYTVVAEMLDENGNVLYKSGKLQFDASVIHDYTLTIPIEKALQVRAITPRLTINYKGKTKVISEGLPSSVIRPTVSNDYSYLCTPLRNLLFPAKADVKFKNNGFLHEPMVRKLKVEADLSFPGHPLNMVEAVQNSNEIFAYDPQNEFLQNDDSRQLFRYTTHYLNAPPSLGISDYKLSLTGAPSAIYFEAEKGKRYKQPNHSVKFKQIPWKTAKTSKSSGFSLWAGCVLFSVKKSELKNAVLTVSGIRNSGYLKGKPFQCAIPLRDLGNYGIITKIFEDGAQVGVETLHRPELLPLPLNKETVSFHADVINDFPNSVIMLRAVSKDGRVWWSKPFIPGKKSANTVTAQIYHNKRGSVTTQVDRERIPVIRYKFDPKFGGNVLTTDAGREYYSAIGGLITAPVGFEGASFSSAASPLSARAGMSTRHLNLPVPEWVKLSDGKWALRFDGKHGKYIIFPPTAMPQRSGFTLEMEVKPEDVQKDQFYFAQCGPGYITGFTLKTRNGKFVIDFRNRRPTDPATGDFQINTHKTNLSPVEGKWNKIKLIYDTKQVTLSVNGKSQSFAQTGMAQWLTLSSFGGTEPRAKQTMFFKGLLRNLTITHRAMKD